MYNDTIKVANKIISDTDLADIFQRMDEDDEVYKLLCNFDDVDFDRYFQY